MCNFHIWLVTDTAKCSPLRKLLSRVDSPQLDERGERGEVREERKEAAGVDTDVCVFVCVMFFCGGS